MGRVRLALTPGGDLLVEVAVPVEKADADERNAEIGGRLEVVAREHAEAARVDRQPLVEPELEREVGDEQVVGKIHARQASRVRLREATAILRRAGRM